MLSINPSSSDSIVISKGVAEIEVYYSEADTISFDVVDKFYSSERVISSLNPLVVCFTLAKIDLKFSSYPGSRDFFYSKSDSCVLPEYANLTVSALNSKGGVTANFKGEIFLSSDNLNNPNILKAQVFTSQSKGVKKVTNTIFSSIEQAIKISATGTQSGNYCGVCSAFSGGSDSINFRDGKVIVGSLTGPVGNLTVPVSLQFADGSLIEKDNTTAIEVSIESGAEKNSSSATIDKTVFNANNGESSFILSSGQSRHITINAVSSPCLDVEKGHEVFTSDSLLVLPTWGKYNKDVIIKFEIHNSFGKVTKKYDGTKIKGLRFIPEDESVYTMTKNTIIKNGKTRITIRNIRESNESKIYWVQPIIENNSLAVFPAKVKFSNKPVKITIKSRITD